MKISLLCLAALALVSLPQRQAFAQDCTPVTTCTSTSRSWEAQAQCGSEALRANSRSFGNELIVNGEPFQALHQIHNLLVIYSEAIGIDDEGNDIEECITGSDEPFETLTVGGCEDAVAHKIVGVICANAF